MNLEDAIRATELSEEKVYCEINPETREISVPETYKIIGVESDEDVERVWFKCPKVVGDNIDLSKYQLRVNYQNANSDKGQYIITDVKIDGDNIIFSWLLGRLVTAYVGKISFIICAVNVSSSDIKNEWNTTLVQAQVLTGLEVEPQDLPTTGDDLINQLKSLTAQTQTFARTAQAASKSARDNADKVQQQADRVEDILENVPDFNEYDTLAQLEKSFYEGRKYNSMTYAGKTSDKGMKLHSVKGKTVQQTTNGYQLFDASKIATKSQGGATVTNNGDGSFTISGSGNLTEDFANMQYSINSYDFKKLFKVGNVYLKGAINKGIYFEVVYIKSGGNLYQRNDKTINLTNEIYNAITSVAIIFYGDSGNAIPNETIKPMFYQDGDGTWEPYTGGKPAPNPDYPMEIQNVEIREITSQSKNLFDMNSASKLNVTFNGKEFIFNPTNGDAILTMPIDTKYIKTGNKFYVSFYAKIGGTPKQAYSDLSPDALSNDIIFDVTEEYKKFSGYLTVRDDKQTNPKFRIYINTSATTKLYVKDVMLFFGVESEYLPYGHDTVETSLTLAEGDTYENGQITRVRKQITFDGSSDENWGMLSSTSENQIIVFVCNNPRIEIENYSTDYFCNRSEPNSTNASGDTEGTYVFANALRIALDRGKASSVEELITWLSTHPLTIEYELETPTTEALEIPTVPSYFPYTEVSTDNTLETDITWKVLADCDNSLKQEALEKRIEALEMNALGE